MNPSRQLLYLARGRLGASVSGQNSIVLLMASTLTNQFAAIKFCEIKSNTKYKPNTADNMPIICLPTRHCMYCTLSNMLDISSPVTDVYLSEIAKNTMQPFEFKIGTSGPGTRITLLATLFMYYLLCRDSEGYINVTFNNNNLKCPQYNCSRGWGQYALPSGTLSRQYPRLVLKCLNITDWF